MTRARLAVLLSVALLNSCSTPPAPSDLNGQIMGEFDKAATRKPDARRQAMDEALLPPLRMDMPSIAGQPIEPRFDLSVNNAPAGQVFMSLVNGTRYSMLLHPGVTGTISLSLKDVTLREALESIRELYGYEFRLDGSRITVQAAGMQTRVFRVNYLTAQRRGMSEVRVQSGSVGDVRPGQSAAPNPVNAAQPVPGQVPGQQLPVASSIDSSRISTQQFSDFWAELRSSLQSIVGTGEGRSVVITPHSGVVVVRAMPDELRGVEHFLRETRISVERQVMLEAKIVEVTLSEAYQAGINWAIFRNNLAVGQLATGRGNTALSASGSRLPLIGGGETVDIAGRAIVAASTATSTGNPASAVFGLAFQTANFGALLQFLESQGDVQVLSSPRVATINNQKAVLKVGTDEFFVTNVSTVSQTVGVSTVQTPTVTVAPFFSGILLDVTPRIDEDGNIMLHIHPSVSSVTESRRVVDLGGSVPPITLPLAKSTVSETDTIVRVPDSNIVAIGGLMSVELRDNRSGIPGVDIDLLRNVDRTTLKKELVILLKPTVIADDKDWEQTVRDSQERLRGFYPREERRR